MLTSKATLIFLLTAMAALSSARLATLSSRLAFLTSDLGLSPGCDKLQSNHVAMECIVSSLNDLMTNPVNPTDVCQILTKEFYYQCVTDEVERTCFDSPEFQTFVQQMKENLASQGVQC